MPRKTATLPVQETAFEYVDGQFVPDLPLSQIGFWEGNPRRTTIAETLQTLTDSIKTNGVQQPIVVRLRENGDGTRFHPIMGARRVQASRMAERATIPAIVRVGISDADALLLAVIENTNREDLNPVEEAEGLRMLRSAGFTQAEIAEKVGLTQSSISRALSLLELPLSIRDMVADGKLTPAHAREIHRFDGHEKAQIELAHAIVEHSIPSKAMNGGQWPEPLVKIIKEFGLPIPNADKKPDLTSMSDDDLRAYQDGLASKVYQESFKRVTGGPSPAEVEVQRIHAEWNRRSPAAPLPSKTTEPVIEGTPSPALAAFMGEPSVPVSAPDPDPTEETEEETPEEIEEEPAPLRVVETPAPVAPPVVPVSAPTLPPAAVKKPEPIPTPPAPTPAVVAKSEVPAAAPTPAPATPKPGPMVTAFLPEGEALWLMGHGLTAAVAIAELRQYKEQEENTTAIRLPSQALNKLHEMAQAANLPPTDYLSNLIHATYAELSEMASE